MCSQSVETDRKLDSEKGSVCVGIYSVFKGCACHGGGDHIYAPPAPIRPLFLMISLKYHSSRPKSTGPGGERGAALPTNILQPGQWTPIVGRTFQKIPIQKMSNYHGDLFVALGLFDLFDLVDVLDVLDVVHL